MITLRQTVIDQIVISCKAEWPSVFGSGLTRDSDGEGSPVPRGDGYEFGMTDLESGDGWGIAQGWDDSAGNGTGWGYNHRGQE